MFPTEKVKALISWLRAGGQGDYWQAIDAFVALAAWVRDNFRGAAPPGGGGVPLARAEACPTCEQLADRLEQCCDFHTAGGPVPAGAADVQFWLNLAAEIARKLFERFLGGGYG